MRVNEQAPIYVRREITIFAPPEKVWDWLSRVDLWQDWHPDIASAYWMQETPDGGPHARFKWRRGPVRVTSLIESWDVAREIGWVGRAYRSVVRQVFRMEGDFRQTHVEFEQSVEGFPVSMLRPIIRALIVRNSETWLGILKTRLESLHERGTGRQRPPRPPTLPSARVPRFRP